MTERSQRRGAARQRIDVGAWAPAIAFYATYATTCLIGATLMLVDYEPFVELFEYFSGTEVPSLQGREFWVALALLVGAPLALGIGYAVGLAVVGRGEGGTPPTAAPRGAFRGAATAFALCAGIGAVSLARSGAFGNIGAWSDYGRWIDARAAGFRALTFAEFVNLYIFLPLSAAWMMLERPPVGGRWRGRFLMTAPAVLAVGLSLLLFQRKAAVTTLILVVAAAAIDHTQRGGAIRRGWAAAATATVVVVYLATVIVPVFEGARGARIEGKSVRVTNSTVAVGLYAALSPVTRTSAPALFYPIIYPDEHRFYGLDLAQDVLGFGGMPDDNLIVWQVMNPELPGTTTAPFQFPLYSQVGPIRAIFLSGAVGLLLASAWRLALRPRWRRQWRALAGALVILFSVYIAIDSLRNSTVVSYGVFWGVVFLGAAVVLSNATTRYRVVVRIQRTS